MLKSIVSFVAAACFVLGGFQIAGASDLCCIGKTEKDVKGVCVVKGFQEGRICMEEIADGKSKACRGLSGCYQLKDLGSAGKDSHVIVTGWRSGDQKCYDGPNCGKVIVVGGGASTQSGAAAAPASAPAAPQQASRESVALPPPPGAGRQQQEAVSLPPPPLPEGVQGQQQGTPTASLPPPPQPQTQPAPQQEPQQPVTQTIDNTLNIFKKAKDLFR